MCHAILVADCSIAVTLLACSGKPAAIPDSVATTSSRMAVTVREHSKCLVLRGLGDKTVASASCAVK